MLSWHRGMDTSGMTLVSSLMDTSGMTLVSTLMDTSGMTLVSSLQYRISIKEILRGCANWPGW